MPRRSRACKCPKRFSKRSSMSWITCQSKVNGFHLQQEQPPSSPVVHLALTPQITDSLREGDELVRIKLHGSTELVVIDGTSEDRSESFGCAE